MVTVTFTLVFRVLDQEAGFLCGRHRPARGY
jgi:hypothetical protein